MTILLFSTASKLKLLLSSNAISVFSPLSILTFTVAPAGTVPVTVCFTIGSNDENIYKFILLAVCFSPVSQLFLYAVKLEDVSSVSVFG